MGMIYKKQTRHNSKKLDTYAYHDLKTIRDFYRQFFPEIAPHLHVYKVWHIYTENGVTIIQEDYKIMIDVKTCGTELYYRSVLAFERYKENH